MPLAPVHAQPGVVADDGTVEKAWGSDSEFAQAATSLKGLDQSSAGV